MKTIDRRGVVFLIGLAACAHLDRHSQSGESCVRTADCSRPLRCEDRVCVEPTSKEKSGEPCAEEQARLEAEDRMLRYLTAMEVEKLWMDRPEAQRAHAAYLRCVERNGVANRAQFRRGAMAKLEAIHACPDQDCRERAVLGPPFLDDPTTWIPSFMGDAELLSAAYAFDWSGNSQGSSETAVDRAREPGLNADRVVCFNADWIDSDCGVLSPQLSRSLEFDFVVVDLTDLSHPDWSLLEESSARRLPADLLVPADGSAARLIDRGAPQEEWPSVLLPADSESRDGILPMETRPYPCVLEQPLSHPRLLSPSQWTQTAPEKYTVLLDTTAGQVTIQVTRSWSPLGADRFFNLVQSGYLTDIAWYRVVPGFVAQGGMHGNRLVNKAWSDALIMDDPVVESNRRGTLSMASTSHENSRSNQFFINLVDNSRLDSMGSSPFGEVVQGMEVVDAFYTPPEIPDQSQIGDRGSEYLCSEYPRLDRILTARVVD